MKKETFDSRTETEKPATPAAKPRSLRPMRSMVAVRSLKPKTAVAAMVKTSEMVVEKN